MAGVCYWRWTPRGGARGSGSGGGEALAGWVQHSPPTRRRMQVSVFGSHRRRDTDTDRINPQDTNTPSVSKISTSPPLPISRADQYNKCSPSRAQQHRRRILLLYRQPPRAKVISSSRMRAITLVTLVWTCASPATAHTCSSTDVAFPPCSSSSLTTSGDTLPEIAPVGDPSCEFCNLHIETHSSKFKCRKSYGATLRLCCDFI